MYGVRKTCIGSSADSELLHGMAFSCVEGHANRVSLSSHSLADFRSYVCVILFSISISFLDIVPHFKITPKSILSRAISPDAVV